MVPITEKVYVDAVKRDAEYIMVGDIGGTNSNFGFFLDGDSTYRLIFSLHVKSRLIIDFPELVNDILIYVRHKYQINIVRSGFAAAGVTSETLDYSKPTNLDIIIDAKQILARTGLTCSFVVNDFAVIGYGLELIDPQHLVVINEGRPCLRANKAILGAGTGLGKCVMDWNKYADRYIPVPSEGGHADCAIHNAIELELVEYIQKIESRRCPISWEDLLSGFGIERMYTFFHSRNHGSRSVKDIREKEPHPDEIFNSRLEDEHAWRTFELYRTMYARCAKNFALDALALAGIYIAGGIAAKNVPLFESDAFIKEFISCGKHEKLLQDIPIYVITDYNVSLYGAAHFMHLEDMCAI